MNDRWRRAAVLMASLGGVSMGCASDDPFDFGGPRSCEVADENRWVYGLMKEAYLWADELPQVDPLEYESANAMVRQLRVGPDRWSRVSNKARSDALFEEGRVVGLGFSTRRDADERVVVSQVTPGSPADLAGLMRGDAIMSVGGLRTAQLDEEDRWSEVYGENMPGVVVDVEVSAPGQRARPVTVTKDWYTINTVPVDHVLTVQDQPVGYLQFATFVDTAPEALDEVFAAWNEAGIRQVIIDLRYNGGGLVSVARHLMNLLAGAAAEGEVSYSVRYNDKLSDEDFDRTMTRVEHSLPEVDAVVFITTKSSLSASELVINGVSAHVPVAIVGDTTGGKPVGSKHFEFCDKIAVPITFEVINADGEGDYFEGLQPTCVAPDDLHTPLGDPAEASLATALHWLETGQCLDPEGEAAEGDEAQAPPAPGFRRRSASSDDPDPWPLLGGLR